MKQLLRLLLGIIPCLFLACDYSPSGSHYEEVDPNFLVEGKINLLDADDTIYIQNERQFSFNISLPGRTFFGYQLIFNDKVVAQAAELQGGYLLNTKDFKDGYYPLHLYAYTSSGSGSLADVRGEEGLVVYRSWVVQIDRSQPNPSAITSITPKVGQLQITWDPTTHKGFWMYELYRYYNGTMQLVAGSSERYHTSFLDQRYVGGQVSYHVVTYTKGGPSSTGPVRGYNHPVPRVLSATFDEDHNLTITHSSTPFYNNLLQYRLVSGYSYISQTTDVNDTVFVMRDVPFGIGGLVLSLNTFPKNMNDFSVKSTQHFVPQYGTQWGPQPADKLMRRPATNLFYTFENTQLQVIDATTLQVKQVRNIQGQQMERDFVQQTVISENGQHLYTFLDNVIHKLHPTSLQTQETTTLARLLPYANYENVSLHVSNNNRLLIEANDPSTGKDTVYVVDMNQKKVIHKWMAGFFPNFSSISPDGKTVSVNENLYIEQSNGTWKQQTLLAGSATEVVYHPTLPLYSIQSGRHLQFYSTVTGAWVKTITTEEELDAGKYYIDSASGYLYGISAAGSPLYVYNFDSGQLVRKQRVVGAVFVYKNRIFSSSYHIPL
jgi:hypothetical protein